MSTNLATGTYCTITDARVDGAQTGEGAEGATPEETRALFERYRHLEVSDDHTEFLLDLHVAGDLTDTICLDAAGFEAVTGHAPESAAYYTALDAFYWEAQEKAWSAKERGPSWAEVKEWFRSSAVVPA
jgi:hypothetical protein